MSDGISVRDEFEKLFHQLFYHIVLNSMSDGISVRDEFEELLHQLFYQVILLLVETIFELMKIISSIICSQM